MAMSQYLQSLQWHSRIENLDCPDGIDELDCHPTSLINCSSSSFVCFSHLTTNYTCYSVKEINDGNIDCIGGVDEAKLCQTSRTSKYDGRFFLDDPFGSQCIPSSWLCNKYFSGLTGDDERFCHHLENRDIFKENGICDNADVFIRFDTEEFLCNQLKNLDRTKIVYFSLGRIPKTKSQLIKPDVDMASTFLSNNEHYCHDHPHLRVWLNKDENNTTMTCLCPPSHYGDRCQYQNQRVSLTIHFRAFSDSWQIPFIVIVSLIDDTDQRTTHLCIRTTLSNQIQH